MENYICPISFINEKPKEDKDLNEMFISGYRDKICSDYTHSIIIDEIKKSIDYSNIPSDSQISWMKDIKDSEADAFADSIMQYLISNITDLVYNQLIIFMQNIGMPHATIDHMIQMLTNEIEVRKIVIDIIASSNIPISRHYPDVALFQAIDISMSSVHSKLIGLILDRFIDSILAIFATVDGMESWYQTIYKVTYNETEVPETSYSNMYNLCAGVLREEMDKRTMDLRTGLMLISKNVVIMCVGNPRYGLEISNPKYITTNEEYEKTGMFNNTEMQILESAKLPEEIN